MKAIVLFQDGFEEIEALSVVDILRRGQITCEMIGMDALWVTGSHQIKVEMDRCFDSSLDADIVIIPGGMPGAAALRDDQRVLSLLQKFHQQDKLIAAICAGPIVLEKAGILKNKNYTCYPGFEKEITSGCYQKTMVTVDQRIITACGPAGAFAFAYAILEKLGGDANKVAETMLYQ